MIIYKQVKSHGICFYSKVKTSHFVLGLHISINTDPVAFNLHIIKVYFSLINDKYHLNFWFCVLKFNIDVLCFPKISPSFA